MYVLKAPRKLFNLNKATRDMCEILKFISICYAQKRQIRSELTLNQIGKTYQSRMKSERDKL